MSTYFKIGKLVATFGLKGEMLFKHELGKKTSLKGLRAIFIEEKKNSFIPYFIESAKIKSEETIYIKLEGINTREMAIKFAQKLVWLPDVDFKKFVAKSSPLNLLGFHIVDSNKDLGPILELIEQPHQLLARLEVLGKEVLIPMTGNFINKINKTTRQVMVTLPEGFLEIYLGTG